MELSWYVWAREVLQVYGTYQLSCYLRGFIFLE